MLREEKCPSCGCNDLIFLNAGFEDNKLQNRYTCWNCHDEFGIKK